MRKPLGTQGRPQNKTLARQEALNAWCLAQLGLAHREFSAYTLPTKPSSRVKLMRIFNCIALGLLAATVTAPSAEAGGLGIDILGGTHTEKVYFFDANSTKFLENQQRPTWGVGIQAILGDRDDALIGIMKFGYINDLPGHSAVSPPEEGFSGDNPTQVTGRLDCEDDSAADLCGPRPVGTVSAGLQWRIWGDPMGLQVSLLPSVGAGVITKDSTEYIQLEFGPGVHYAFSKQLQALLRSGYLQTAQPCSTSLMQRCMQARSGPL